MGTLEPAVGRIVVFENDAIMMSDLTRVLDAVWQVRTASQTDQTDQTHQTDQIHQTDQTDPTDPTDQTDLNYRKDLVALSADPPDLVIADPATWKGIRSYPRLHDLPVIVVCTPDCLAAAIELLDPQHDDYLVAPFTDAELVGRVRTRIEVSRLQRRLHYRAALLEAEIESAPQAILAVSRDRKVLACNRRFEQIWRLPAGIIHEGDESPALMRECLEQVVDPDAFEAGIRWGHAHPEEFQRLDVPLTDGRILSGEAAPIIDADGLYIGRIWSLSDDTERRTAEAERGNLLERLQAVQRSQAFLLKAANTLARASGYAETLQRLAALAVPTLGDLCLIDVIGDDGDLHRMAACHADPDQQPLVEELGRHYPPDPAGAHPSVEVIRTGRSMSSNEMSDDFLRLTCRDERHFHLTKALNYSAYMTVPLTTNGEALGAVTLISTDPQRRFGPSDLSVAEDLATQVAAVVAKARQYEDEHQTAHILQGRLLPAELPTVDGMEIAVRYLPASRGAEVGGDFYDVVALPSGRIGFAIGDVAGHDAGAAAIMGQLRSAARALAGQVREPGQLVDALQWSWELLGFDRIATAVFGRLDTATGDLVMASAGHPPPLLVTGGSASFVPLQPASPLGSPSARPQEWRGRLDVDNVLFLYTDGLIEQRDVGVNLGLELLASLASTAPSRCSADQLCDWVLTGLAGERDDDVAVLAIGRRLPGSLSG